MEVSGSGGLGEQGLLGAPPAAQKKKPNYMYFTHTPHDTHHTHTTQHTHSCTCKLPSSTTNDNTDITGEGIGQNNTDTPDGLTAANDLQNRHIIHGSQVSDLTNEIKGERDQNSTTKGINVVQHLKDILPFHESWTAFSLTSCVTTWSKICMFLARMSRATCLANILM